MIIIIVLRTEEMLIRFSLILQWLFSGCLFFPLLSGPFVLSALILTVFLFFIMFVPISGIDDFLEVRDCNIMAYALSNYQALIQPRLFRDKCLMLKTVVLHKNFVESFFFFFFFFFFLSFFDLIVS